MTTPVFKTCCCGTVTSGILEVCPECRRRFEEERKAQPAITLDAFRWLMLSRAQADEVLNPPQETQPCR